MKVLYEILVPTMFGYPFVTPISTKHHKNWDKEVQKITGGLTICKPAEGRWINKGIEYPERVIPVRIMCDESIPEGKYNFSKSQINKIVQFTLSHYRQKAVMYYVISKEVNIVFASNQDKLR